MKGTIYLISNSVDEMVYVGSTVQKLSNRLNDHRSSAKSGSTSNIHTYMRKVGLHKWTMDAIKTQEVEDRQELEKLEFKCMDFFHRSLLLNNDTEYKKKSVASCKKNSLSQRGIKTLKFKRGSVQKIDRIIKGVNYPEVRFLWNAWIGDTKTRKMKSFSINKYGEIGAMTMAKEYQNKIYPITE